jgi:four helix bundle protein
VDSNSQDDDDNCPLQKKIESFQDLVVWQKSMDLVTESYVLVHRLPQNEQYRLASQMRRAAVSIPANIAEGFGRWHSKEFVHFLLVANGSLKELETHLLIGKRLGFFRAPELAKPVSLVEEIGRMLAAPRKRPER